MAENNFIEDRGLGLKDVKEESQESRVVSP
jgi:hypothetical protein